jgi:hypothetical protein
MYLNRAKEVDKNMAQSWKGDADGMLVFVSPHSIHHAFAYNLENVDWFILCCRCGIARGHHPGYSAKLTGHIGLLSRKHLSATKWDPGSHLAQSLSVIHPSYFGPLGQRALVYEPGYQSYLRRPSDVATAVVA